MNRYWDLKKFPAYPSMKHTYHPARPLTLPDTPPLSRQLTSFPTPLSFLGEIDIVAVKQSRFEETTRTAGEPTIPRSSKWNNPNPRAIQKRCCLCTTPNDRNDSPAMEAQHFLAFVSRPWSERLCPAAQQMDEALTAESGRLVAPGGGPCTAKCEGCVFSQSKPPPAGPAPSKTNLLHENAVAGDT